MGKPHKIAFHDSKKDKIVKPSEARNYKVSSFQKGIFLFDGDVYTHEAESYESHSEWSQYKSITRLMDHHQDRFTPLLYTGFQSRNDEEVFEGHIFKPKMQYRGQGIVEKWEEEPMVIYWAESLGGFHYDSDKFYRGEVIGYDLIGHALTDPELVPELVPEDFDVEEYFQET